LGSHRLVQRRALLVQSLRALGIAPDIRILEFAGDFLQALLLALEVKDTP
jgi:hypothetical protein